MLGGEGARKICHMIQRWRRCASTGRYGTRGTNESPSSGTDGERLRERGHEGYIPDRDKRLDDEALTFLLDMPVLNIDELDLEI